MEVDKKFTSYVLDSMKQTDSDPTECTVMVDNMEFKANKLHLMTCSDFFKEVFKEESSIIIKGIKPETYKVVHQALLTGQIALNEANTVELWFASHYLKIKYLPEKCEDYIQQNLMKNNYLILYNDVLAMGSDIVFDKLMSLIIEDFERFSLTHLFLELSTEMFMKVVANSKTISPDILVRSIHQRLKFDPQDLAGNYQFNLYDDLRQVRDTSDTNVVQTFVFNKEHVRKFVPSHTSHSEERKASKFKVFQHFVRKIKPSQLSDEGRKTFTLLLNENGFNAKAFQIPSWLAKLYTEKGLENVELDSTQDKPTAEDEPVIVFRKDQQFTLYSLKTYEFYVVKFLEKKAVYDFEVYDNELYFSMNQNNSIETYKVTRSKTVVHINVGNVVASTILNCKYFMAYPFIYRFEVNSYFLTASRFCLESEDGQWSVFDKMHVSRNVESYNNNYFYFNCTFCTENKIVFKQNDCHFYFDLKLTKLCMQSDYFDASCSGSKAICNDSYDYIDNIGKLYKSVYNENNLQFNTCIVWNNGAIPLYGAEFFDNKLFIFTDAVNVQQKDIIANLGFDVKIVKLLGELNKCVFMTVPRHWLTHKI